MSYIKAWARVGPLLLLLCSVQGCGMPSPVTTPPAGDVKKLRNEQSGYAPGSSEATNPLNVMEVRDWGYAYVDRHCVDFFAALQSARSQGEFASNTLTAAAASTAAILALAEATTKATGVTAAALGFTAVTLNEFRRTALLTDYPDETQQLVREALTAYRGAAGTPSTLGEATSLVAGYAQICTLSGIRFLVRESIMTARPKAGSGEAGGTQAGGTTPRGPGQPTAVSRESGFAPAAAPAMRQAGQGHTPLVPSVRITR
jgi:hypothetical protein